MPVISTTLARQLHRASIAALTLSSLFLTPTYAAAPIAGPGKTTPQIGSPASGGGEITSPGDTFMPSRPNGDTRRPPKSNGGRGDGGGEAPPDQPPVTTGELICRVRMGDDGLAHNYLVNDTGATIPAGSKVTVHIQPGDTVRTFIVEKDWPAGQMVDGMAGWSLPDGASCEASFGPPDPPAEQQPGGQEFVISYFTGETGHLGKPGEMLKSGVCLVQRYEGVMLLNSGYATWPVGTHVKVTLSNGQVFEMTFSTPFQELNGVDIPPELVYYPEAGPTQGVPLPLDLTCQIEVEFPAN